MLLDQPLVGPRLILRNLSAVDATSRYLGWLHDGAVAAYLESRFSPPKTTAELASFIAAMNDSRHSLFLGMFLDDGLTHIGNIKLGPIDSNHGVGDIGILIGARESWGKGLATEAICLLRDHAFASLKLAKLTAGCYASNEGSQKAFVKSGFLIEGRRIAQVAFKGRREDATLLGLVNPAVASLAGGIAEARITP
jgi:[ribosomal protein S5]-alanine N-acetyltransferase